MEQIELVLAEFPRGDAEPAQRTKAGIDAINCARLCRQRFYQFAAAPNQWPGFGRQGARRLL